mmetsp:Transcript_7794/g.11559  ORF Transcript_7794/g.11559 Transcript_7794/m.11559 type:complete len:118 (+) Transcript_7794:51-404(+)
MAKRNAFKKLHSTTIRKQFKKYNKLQLQPQFAKDLENKKTIRYSPINNSHKNKTIRVAFPTYQGDLKFELMGRIVGIRGEPKSLDQIVTIETVVAKEKLYIQIPTNNPKYEFNIERF